MRKIQGYKLKNVPVERVEMPLGSRILVAMDVNGEPTIFADIDGEETLTEMVPIYRLVTGKPVEANILAKRYIGSFLIANYGIVYHFFTGGDPQELNFDFSLVQAAQAGPPERPLGA